MGLTVWSCGFWPMETRGDMNDWDFKNLILLLKWGTRMSTNMLYVSVCWSDSCVWKVDPPLCLVFSFFVLSASLCPSLPTFFLSLSSSPVNPSCLSLPSVRLRPLVVPMSVLLSEVWSRESYCERLWKVEVTVLKVSQVIFRGETLHQLLAVFHLNQQKKQGCGFTKDFCF